MWRQIKGQKPERRKKHRFPMQREMRYRLIENTRVVGTGHGRTIDIGSGGVAFQSEELLSSGMPVELSISWPVLLEDECPVRLIVFGRVVRTQGKRAACTVDRYEFRTQARSVPISGGRVDSKLYRWADAVWREDLKLRAAQQPA